MMRITHGIDALRQVSAGSVMSIGNFDGLHLGHAKILQIMRELRTPGAKMVVVTFEPHPFTVLRPQFAPPRLTTPATKEQLLESMGVDELVVLAPSRDVLSLTAQAFWEILRDEAKPAHLVEGSSFTFGKNRGGTIETLRQWTSQSRVKLSLVPAVEATLLDLHIVQVNSSLIRWLIAYGRVRDAAICLGRNYTIAGKVVRGHGRGRTIGVPTANLQCDDQLIPAEGVYAARCEIDDAVYPVALSIGTNPTFADNQLQVEAHLIGFDGDLYNREVEIELIDWVRDQLRFTSVELLKEQIARDIHEAKGATFVGPAPSPGGRGDHWRRADLPHTIFVLMTDVYQQLIQLLRECKRVLITTHVRPDGDAIGTTAALALAMKKVGIDSEVLLLSPLPEKYAFVYHENRIVFYDAEKHWPAELVLDNFDALLVADTGTWSQLPGVREKIENWNRPKLVLDHHLTQEDWADAKLVIKDAAAACEIAAELIETWPIEIDAAIATALFIGITSDTGWFQFSNTRPFTLRLAATLMEKGVDTDRIYQMLYQNERPQRLALQTRAMQSLEFLHDGRVAIMIVRKEDFAKAGAKVSDTENLINLPLQIRNVEVSIFFTETPEPGPIRVSLRSKGNLDCAKFAEQFGGGGHARAAGLKIAATLNEALQQIKLALAPAITSPIPLSK
jgi:riboflavin kinase/FMN adenylyltransferase